MNSTNIEITQAMLEAGERALREAEPELFDYGQGSGWHYELVKKVLLAGFRASPKAGDTLDQRDSEL